jgi:hypothetical protein
MRDGWAWLAGGRDTSRTGGTAVSRPLVQMRPGARRYVTNLWRRTLVSNSAIPKTSAASSWVTREAGVEVLGASDHPLRAQEMRALVEQRLDRPVILHSIITCLRRGGAICFADSPDPAEIAYGVLFLACAESSLMTARSL